MFEFCLPKIILQRLQFRYPNAKHCNLKVDRYMPAQPKPVRHVPPAPEMGSVVHEDQKTHDNRCATLNDLFQQRLLRIVGESIFAFGSSHERLLQLQRDDTEERWYVRESELNIPHIILD